MQIQSLYKVHLKNIMNGELSDPLCGSENRLTLSLTLVRLDVNMSHVNIIMSLLYSSCMQGAEVYAPINIQLKRS